MLFNPNLQIKDVRLVPLSENFFEPLVQLAQEKSIWQYYRQNFHQPAVFKELWLDKALKEIQANERFVYVVLINNQLAGTSSYYHIDAKHKTLDIGYTWYHPTFWGSGVNLKTKYLLLKQVFEDQDEPINRVGFWIDSLNQRSCKAVEKIGAQYEGTLRNHLMRPDGTIRHSAVFSILLSEWPKIKTDLSWKYLF